MDPLTTDDDAPTAPTVRVMPWNWDDVSRETSLRIDALLSLTVGHSTP